MAKTRTKNGAKGESKTKTKRRRVSFSLQTIGAKEVVLVGDFNNWNSTSHPMKNDQNDIWSKTVMLPVGTYEYKFLVDGIWRLDPQNNQTCPNCFGTYNNIFNLIES